MPVSTTATVAPVPRDVLRADRVEPPLLPVPGVVGRGRDTHVRLGVDDVRVRIQRGERLPDRLAGLGGDDLRVGKQRERADELHVGVVTDRHSLATIEAWLALDDDVFG
jgi:hypothetical protein